MCHATVCLCIFHVIILWGMSLLERDGAPRSFYTAAVLDNLPKVEAAKYDKLAGVVRKIISQVGVSIRGGMPSCQSKICCHSAG